MRISPVRLLAAVLLFALLSACVPKQPPLQGTWSNFSDEKEKTTKEPPKEE